VYDHFLGKEDSERRKQGAYYTPMFLADTVVSQVWELLPPEVRESGHFLDPACGSGIFLVRSFQRLCENWRFTRNSRTIRWSSLLKILGRIHGWDMNGNAVRIAVFSLYVALLEEVSPPNLDRLVKRGRLLPLLWGRNLIQRDYFETSSNTNHFAVIIGNPPWKSRRGPDRSSVRWCIAFHRPMPGGEDAWAFVWKSSRHLTRDGVVAFLLPAMGFLHNHANDAVAARNELIKTSRIHRIINFSDLRFQLFEGAIRPAALIIFGSNENQELPYVFDYWTPKADLNLQVKRVITLSSPDKMSLSSANAILTPMVFKRRLWMREPEAKLFGYLSRFRTLGDLIMSFGSIRRRRVSSAERWVIGQGFQPFHEDRQAGRSQLPKQSKYVGWLPYLPIEAFQRLGQPVSDLVPWSSPMVRRNGFEAGYNGPRVLVPRGVETSQMRLRATFTDAPLTFQHIIQAITVPPGESSRAKLLTALLNSRVAFWFAFHGTASFGSERPEVAQAELLGLPFPEIDDLPEPDRARKAARRLIELIDEAVRAATGAFALQQAEVATLREVDRLAYEYFCLSDDEILLIEDAIEFIIPSVQPSQGSYPDIWRSSGPQDRSGYTETLIKNLDGWLNEGCAVRAQLEASSADLGILRLTLGSGAREFVYKEKLDTSLEDLLSRIYQHSLRALGGNFQLIPDFRVFIGKDLYLVKPMQKRFWLRSMALADSDSIAMDLQDAVELDSRRGKF